MVSRSIELIFRNNAARGSDPSNVLCFGYRKVSVACVLRLG